MAVCNRNSELKMQNVKSNKKFMYCTLAQMEFLSVSLSQINDPMSNDLLQIGVHLTVL